MMDIKEKQPLIYKQLATSLKKQRLAHAYLLEGEKGTGKMSMAIWLTQSVFCLDNTHQPCGKCSNCERIKNGEHPDVTQIVPEGQTIKVDQIRNIKETFMKSGMETKQKVLIIQDADKMTVSAANSLLKFIEEPDGQILILLLTKVKAQILPTIQSRCQILHFSPLSERILKETLVQGGMNEQKATLLVQLTNSQEKAIEISENEWFNDAKGTTDKWLQYVLQKDAFAFVYVQQKISKQYKEKEQQTLFFDLILIRFREILAQSIQGTLGTDLRRHWNEQTILKSIESILESRRKLNANVSFQNVCEQLTVHLLS